MNNSVRYLVTDNWDIFHICDTLKEAQETALDEARSCDCVSVYEMKLIGNAYIPDPDPVFEPVKEQNKPYL